ncbi:hypothetical protein BY458DRAFT_194038 [Sporodiniella umbellata]|nr:hypothetical protein BY458DRAFT_194038 [Sporodiniella umbellata]
MLQGLNTDQHHGGLCLEEMPRILDYQRKKDTISVYTTLPTLDTTLIRIALDSYIVPTECYLHPEAGRLCFHACIPADLGCRQVPIYLVLLGKEWAVLDRWCVGTLNDEDDLSDR